MLSNMILLIKKAILCLLKQEHSNMTYLNIFQSSLNIGVQVFNNIFLIRKQLKNLLLTLINKMFLIFFSHNCYFPINYVSQII